MPRELIITNGDAAAMALREAGIGVGDGDRVLPWRDILYEGPVPATPSLPDLSALRADYLAARGFGGVREIRLQFAERDRALLDHADFDLVTLWFEQDLCDMLQLLQLLDFFAGDPRDRATLRLVHTDRALTRFDAAGLQALAAAARPAGTARLNQAQEAWERWRAPDPRPWLALGHRPRLEIKHLWRAALVTEGILPRADSGLSWTERFVLDALAQAPASPHQMFAAFTRWHDGHCGAYMGDWSFFAILDDLAAAREPLIIRASGERFDGRADVDHQMRYTQQPFAISMFGREVLAGHVDHVATNRLDRWMGGTHLTNARPWRYDTITQRVIPPK